MLEHIKELQPVFKEFKRVAKEDALFIFVLPTPGWRLISSFGYFFRLIDTSVFLGYGMASSFEWSPPKFLEEMQALIEVIRKTAGKETRIVILSPLRHEKLGGAFPNPTKHNIELLAYSETLRTVAKENGAHFVDLFAEPKAKHPPLTQNGIHAHDDG